MLEEPQWMPADEGRSNAPPADQPKKMFVELSLFRAHIQGGTSQRF